MSEPGEPALLLDQSGLGGDFHAEPIHEFHRRYHRAHPGRIAFADFLPAQLVEGRARARPSGNRFAVVRRIESVHVVRMPRPERIPSLLCAGSTALHLAVMLGILVSSPGGRFCGLRRSGPLAAMRVATPYSP